MVGTSACPFVICPLDHISTSALVAQWEAQWNNWLNGVKTDTATFWEQMTEWEEDAQEQWQAWFDNLVYVLDGDVAGHLQNEIDDLAARTPLYFHS